MADGDSAVTADPIQVFCDRLRRLWKASRVTQEALARKVGLDKRRISEILGGKIKKAPDWGVVAKIVRACLTEIKEDERRENSRGLKVPEGLDESDLEILPGWRRRHTDLEVDLRTSPRPGRGGVRARQAEEHRARSERLDRVSDPISPGDEKQRNDGDVAWLRPELRVVDFISRPELDRLRDWADRKTRTGLMLMTGAAGVGKTRLALELPGALGAGWLCRSVKPGEEEGVMGAARESHPGDLLLIVDYAEKRDPEPMTALLREITENPDGSCDSRVRVLLIARGQGDWWYQLEAAPGLAGATGPPKSFEIWVS
jgi:transcriptional regulator with XRE-family HTH domain